mgnify:FL=1
MMRTRTERWGVLVGLPNGRYWDGRGPVPEYLALAIPQYLGKFAPTQDIEIRWSSLGLGGSRASTKIIWPTGQEITIERRQGRTGSGASRYRLTVTFPIPSPVHLDLGRIWNDDGSLACGCGECITAPK